MIDKFLLLGGTGYIGLAFQDELNRRRVTYQNITRNQCDYTQFRSLVELLRDVRPTFLINCAGFTGKPNVDACESKRAETLLGNAILPQTIAHACEVTSVPWGNVSSGCIYAGGKVRVAEKGPAPDCAKHPQAAEKGSDPDCQNGPAGASHNRGLTPFLPQHQVETDLMRPDLQAIWQQDRSVINGFTEDDAPNFSFRSPPCSFYSGSKALGEEVLADANETYVWRLRIPFDGGNSPRNYLSKICNYPRVYDNANSLSNRSDFPRVCLDLWEMRAPFGIYHVTNPGWVTTRDVATRLKTALGRNRDFDFFENDADFYQSAASTPRSNTVLDTTKILATGVNFRSVEEALDEAIPQFARQHIGRT